MKAASAQKGKKGKAASPKAKKQSGKAAAKNLDEFMQTWSDDDDEDEDSSDEETQVKPPQQANGKDSSGEEEEEEASGDEEGSEDDDDSDEEDKKKSDDDSSDDDDDDSEEDVEQEEKKQKEYLKSLNKSDPEFYKFLKEEGDESLIAAAGKDEGESGDDEGEEGGGAEEGGEDSSEDEDDDQVSSASAITNKMIDKWTQRLKETPNVQAIAEVVQAFRSAVQSVGGGGDDEGKDKDSKDKKSKAKPKTSKFLVEDASKFNSVLKLCIGHMPAALATLLKVSNEKKSPKESKNWSKLNKHLKAYTLDLAKVITATSSASVLSALLKHVHVLVPYYAALPKSAKAILKVLINVWSTHKEDKARVLAYMCILRLARLRQQDKDDDESQQFQEMVLKQMYMAYIRNVKFTSPSAWPNINFMRRSLAEMMLLDEHLCYRYAFVYIRQLTIHLRNAMIQGKNKGQSSSGGNKKSGGGGSKKGPKDAVQSVYNWQFIHSVHLWSQLLTDSYPNAPELEPLIYPLIQLMTGAIKLVYSPAYFPLRFHLCRLLTQLSAATGKYVPILPFYLDVLQTFDFGKKTKKVSMKPMNFSCILRLSKSQMAENGFKDAVVEQVYAGILDNMASNANRISFPEISVPVTTQLRTFVKNCPVANFAKKMRQLLDKINENSGVVLAKRRKIRDFGVRDSDKIEAWENKLKSEGNLPLVKFFDSWKAVNEKNVMKNMNKEQLNEFETTKLPSDDDDEDYDDDEDDEDSEEEEEVAKEVPAKKRKSKEVQEEESPKAKKSKKAAKAAESDDDDEAEDQVTDFNMDDFGEDEQEEEEEEENGEEEEGSEGEGDDDDEESDQDSDDDSE